MFYSRATHNTAQTTRLQIFNKTTQGNLISSQLPVPGFPPRIDKTAATEHNSGRVSGRSSFPSIRCLGLDLHTGFLLKAFGAFLKSKERSP